jgi:DNA-binding phage protein
MSVHRLPVGIIDGDDVSFDEAVAALRDLVGLYTKVQVAEELGVSRHTLWRALSQEADQ